MPIKQISLILILLAASALLLLKNDSMPLIGVDEPRYAEAAREMIERKDLITPYLHYETRFDKPILFYWEEILAYKFFGINEFAARLPSVLAGLALIIFAFLLGELQGFGAVAALIMASSIATIVFSKLSITDMSLNAFISGSLTCFALGYRNRANYKRVFAFKNKASSKWFITAFIFAALAFLCKGPVSIALPGLIVLIFLFLQGDLKRFILDTREHLLIGFGTFLALVLPWYIAVHQATDGAFTYDFFIHHNFERYTSTVSNHHGPVWFYIPVIAASLFPWSFFLLQSLWKAMTDSESRLNSKEATSQFLPIYCLIWIATVFAFFTISGTKLVTYILPIYLPCSILIASWWQDKFNVHKTLLLRNNDALIGIIGICLATITGLYLSMQVFDEALAAIDSNAFFIPLTIIGFILISSSVVAATAIYKQPKLSFAFLCIATMLVYCVTIKDFMSPLAHHIDDGIKAFASTLKENENFVSYRLRRESLLFYAKRQVPILKNKDLLAYLTGAGLSKNFDRQSLHNKVDRDLRTGTRYFISKSKDLERFDKFLAKKEINNKPYIIIEQGPRYTIGLAYSNI